MASEGNHHRRTIKNRVAIEQQLRESEESQFMNQMLADSAANRSKVVDELAAQWAAEDEARRQARQAEKEAKARAQAQKCVHSSVARRMSYRTPCGGDKS